ncbi:MAG: response regulator [Halobacteriales archaeon]|nr:response regulator [Halobacteriales archaeon]
MTANPTVLIVDDEPDIREALQTFLEKSFAGVRVITAGSAQEGIAALRQGPDLVLADHRMPGRTGLDFLLEVRLRSPDVPRVLMTGHPDAQVAIKALNEAGIQRLLVKPFDPEKLAALLRELLEVA